MNIKVYFLSFFLCFSLIAHAFTPQGIVNEVIKQYRDDNYVTATALISSLQGQQKALLVMNGNKFRLLSPDAKCWYDGYTQWAYSSATKEVNITTPTPEELQMSNPYAALGSIKSDYNAVMMKSSIASNFQLKLTPKKKDSQIKEIHLSIAKTNWHIAKIIFVMDDKSTYTITISNYKTNQKFSQSTFKFDKNEVPKGTPIVDLR